MAASALGGLSLVCLLVFPMALLGIEMFSSGDEVVAYAVLGTLLGLLSLVSLAAISTALLALWKLRRARGAETGYAWATGGLLMAAIPQTVAALLLVYVASNLFSEDNSPTSTAAVGPTIISTFDPATGKYVTEQIGVDFNFTPNLSPPVMQRTGPIGPNAIPPQSPTASQVGGLPQRIPGQPEAQVGSDIVQASFTDPASEPVTAGASVELPPEPAPAVIDSNGIAETRFGTTGRDWEELFRSLPVMVEPTFAGTGTVFSESPR